MTRHVVLMPIVVLLLSLTFDLFYEVFLERAQVQHRFLFISSFLLCWCFWFGPKSTPKAKGFDPSPQIVCNSMSLLGGLSSFHIDSG